MTDRRSDANGTLNVLITSASRKVSLVRAFQEALRAAGGGVVIAADVSPLAPALYVADEHGLVPRSDSPAFVPALRRLCGQRHVRLVVPTRDEELPVFAQAKDEFAQVGVTVMVPDPATVRTCQDKKQFLRFCAEHGFGTPRSYDTARAAAAGGFPVFVKPRRGKGGRGAVRVESPEELERTLRQMPDAIIQELVTAPEYTVDLFADFAGRVISVVPRERVLTFGGESFVTRTCKAPALTETSVRLSEELGLIGHNTIQCFLCGDEVKFIEVNPRFGGAARLGFEAGAPTPLFLVRLLKGETLEPQVGRFKDNRVMLRYTDDLFLDAAELTDRRFA